MATPDGWRDALLGDVVDPERRVTYGIVQPGGRQDAGVPIIRGKDYSSGRVNGTDLYLVHPDIAAKYKRSELKGGDILLSIVGYLGLVAIVPAHLAGANITQTTARVAIAPPNDATFFFHQLQGPLFKEEIRRFEKGSAQAGLNLKDVVRMRVLVPPLPEQRKIAAILSSVDDVIEKTEAVIEQLQVVKKAMMQELLTRGLPGRHTRFKQTEIGEVPEEWEVSLVGACCELHNNLRKPIEVSERERMSGPYPYYGPTKVLSHINEYRVDGTYALIGEDGDHFLKFDKWPMTQLATGRFNVNNHAHVVRGTDRCATEWFFQFFKHRNIVPHLTRQGAGRYKLRKATLLELPIALPPVAEQHAISDLVTGVERRIASEAALKEVASQTKAALMSVLLTGELRVTPHEDAA